MNRIFNEIKESLDKASTVLITSHRDADGDSLGSMLALKNYAVSLGKICILLNHGDIPDKYRFFPGIDLIIDARNYREPVSVDLVIVLECPTPERCGDVIDYFPKEARLINIDHHPDNSEYGDIVLVDAKASSVGEILTEFFIYSGYEIDTDTAMVLFAAILTDTGRFRFESTSRKTMELAGRLIDFGARPRYISDKIYYSRSSRILKLTGRLLAGMELYENDKICLMTLDNSMLNGDKLGPADTEGMAELTMFDNNVLVGGFLREIEEHKVKISLRSRGKYNVSRLAHKYGGGGHANASGFTISTDLQEARRRLLSDLKGLINV
jgi:phosphoesterase RecJ-like protein